MFAHCLTRSLTNVMVRTGLRSLLVPAALLLIFLTLLPQVLSRAWRPEDLPSPQRDPDGVCGRKSLKSVVCDPDGYLSKEHADTIDGLANLINEGKEGFTQIQCPGGTNGAQLAVAIVDRMHVATNDRKSAAFEFARRLHDKWGVGDSRCETGIVMFFSITDRVVGVSTGRGVKSFFTEGYVQTLTTLIRDQLRQKQYGPALIKAVNVVGKSLNGEAPHEQNGLTGLFIFFFFTTAIIIISSICNRRDQRRSRDRYTRCRHVLERLDEDCDRVQRDSFVARTCPICLDDFSGAFSEASDASAATAGGESSTTSTVDDDEISASPTRGMSSAVASSPGHARGLNSDAGNLRLRTGNQDKTSTSHRVAEGSSSETKALTLRCGHKFHSECIKKWITGPNRVNATCPVCRKRIDDDDNQTPLADHASSASEQRAGGLDMFDNEYRFRLHRARFYFPDFITAQMVNEWENDRIYRRARNRLATSPTFRASNPTVVARSVGRSGSSFSFGGSGGYGGSSGGGGGGGASW